MPRAAARSPSRMPRQCSVREDIRASSDQDEDLPVPAPGGDAADDRDAPGAAQAEAPPATGGEMQRQLDEQRDRYLRLAAEFDNFRKRTTRERQESGARAQGELITRLLDVFDDLGRVTTLGGDAAGSSAVVTGVEAIQRKLLATLDSLGLQVIDPLDQPFDPVQHEAVATAPALSPEDDHLVGQVYQPGYSFKGQLLRPARVVVKQWNR